uniref:Uncharacterized protein n=1 Tax=Glossina pallidipes TaxID=7398 RepID=A0A1B0A1T2_GLOPL
MPMPRNKSNNFKTERQTFAEVSVCNALYLRDTHAHIHLIICMPCINGENDDDDDDDDNTDDDDDNDDDEAAFKEFCLTINVAQKWLYNSNINNITTTYKNVVPQNFN